MAQRLSRRLGPLALLAAVLAAVPGPHDGARAAVPGKNGRIAFVRSAGAGPLEEVFMVSPGSGLTANLTSDPFTSDTAPSWSPDGTRLAFTREGPGGLTNIMALNLAVGIREFTNIRAFWVQPADAAPPATLAE
jgi:Tol biopolymer transport system component